MQILFIDQGNVTIDNLTLRNGDALSGGAIFNGDTLTVIRSTLVGNATAGLGVARTPESRIFVAHGQNIASMRVDVYSLGGRRVYAGESDRPVLRWNQRNADGQPLANGVYLYRVTVEGADGETITKGIRKLVVLR